MSCLLAPSVNGYSRVPDPPARMIPFLTGRLRAVRSVRDSSHNPKARDQGQRTCGLTPEKSTRKPTLQLLFQGAMGSDTPDNSTARWKAGYDSPCGRPVS